MILCDTGPLVALANPREAKIHARCVEVLAQWTSPLLTTWVCLAEAFHLAGRMGGWPCQEVLWKIVANPDAVEIHMPSQGEPARMRKLMEQYRNVPMDLADASLIVAAESRQVRRIFTLDSDFLIFRTSDGGAFDIVPGVAGV